MGQGYIGAVGVQVGSKRARRPEGHALQPIQADEGLAEPVLQCFFTTAGLIAVQLKCVTGLLRKVKEALSQTTRIKCLSG